ncbi:glycoside hydrolase family 5 protein [Rickenella mellea]|uniref:Glycoside hydrolase family 5 protein n=1 Tax=Rickenella mellea TaxID=50990 RepID=A0A4Y7PSY5_9AGAM|nr:glycoside hydrolase family 5 protein [Rickenella mellea]
MPKVPSASPATGKPTAEHFIHTVDCNFVDNNGRTLLLRGVNLSGSSKAPVGQPSRLQDELWLAGESGECSFVGRPLNLDDGSADVHLARLRGWGFNMLRFPITWEALEHEGPGKYDYQFLDYTVKVLRRCKEFGFKVFMDPHQDIWSRYSGGSGAPYWTLLASGINPRNFSATQSAILHSEYPSAENPDPASLPAMIWSTNYGRLASQTLFTLFFAGRDYAPKCVIDGQNIQDYLQSHFIKAIGMLADRIRDAGDLLDVCVIGWDGMNEPAEGFCGHEDLNTVPTEQGSTLRKGSRPTPAQSLRLGMGQAQTVEHWSFGPFGPQKDGTVTIDPKGRKMWLEPEADVEASKRWGWTRDPSWKLGTCIWALHGVWDIESGFILTPGYFKNPPFDPERPVVFTADYWRPHWRSYAERIRQSHPEAILFIHPPVFAQPPPLEEEDICGRACYSAHYYDGLTLVTRHWNWFNADALGMLRGKYSSIIQAVKIGERAIRKSFQEQFAILKDDAKIIGQYPTLLGEIGIPFDMDGKRSYGWTGEEKHIGDYTNQQKALDASLNGADGPNSLNYTIWTYCTDNSHEWGDDWNMEDLSLWSSDDLRPKDTLRVRMAPNDSSSAALLKKSNNALVSVHSIGAAATSALSLATLGAVSMEEDQESNGFLERWKNPYEFLTDGARAVKAFSRPYPTATVGTPAEIAFDIAKAHFKLVVHVKPEDRPTFSLSEGSWVRPSSSASSSSSRSSASSSSVRPPPTASGGVDGDEEKLSELPTEIFIPLVHYAKAEIVASCNPNPVEQTEEDGSGSPTRTHSSPYLNGSTLEPRPFSSASASTATLALLPNDIPHSLLDIDVRVTAGRWEVDGQTLRWWYPVPPADSGAVEWRHTIEVTRKGGRIKTAFEEPTPARGLLVDSCEKMCSGDACCIM